MIKSVSYTKYPIATLDTDILSKINASNSILNALNNIIYYNIID